jgi:hypothetical protein
MNFPARRNGMLNLEDLTEDQLKRLQATFARLAVPPDVPHDVREHLAKAKETVEQVRARVEASEPAH